MVNASLAPHQSPSGINTHHYPFLLYIDPYLQHIPMSENDFDVQGMSNSWVCHAYRSLKKGISSNSGIEVSTCSSIIREAKRLALANNDLDLCDVEKVMPRSNARKGTVVG